MVGHPIAPTRVIMVVTLARHSIQTARPSVCERSPLSSTRYKDAHSFLSPLLPEAINRVPSRHMRTRTSAGCSRLRRKYQRLVRDGKAIFLKSTSSVSRDFLIGESFSLCRFDNVSLLSVRKLEGCSFFELKRTHETLEERSGPASRKRGKRLSPRRDFGPVEHKIRYQTLNSRPMHGAIRSTCKPGGL